MFAKKNVKNIYALTPLQEGILFHALYGKESAIYFEQFNYHISGEIDVHIFEDAWNEMMRRHDIFRTVFVHKNVPQPLQIVLRKRKMDFLSEDLCSISSDEQRAYCSEYRKKDKKRYFDLSKDVLMRIALFQLGEKSFNVTWSFHHIVMDGWSVGVVYEEVLAIYDAMRNGTDAILPPAVPFGEYVKWLKKQDTDAAKNYWREYLSDYCQLAGLPRIASENKRAYVQEIFEFSLTEHKTSGLNQTASHHHITLNTVIQVAWGILLGKYNDTEDVVFASTVSGRPADIKGIERIVGLFINAIPVRIQIKPGQTLRNLLQKIQEDAAENQDYHYYSLADIQADTVLKQHLLDHLLIFENYPDLGEFQEGSKTEFVVDKFEQFELTNYDLSVQIFPGETLSFRIIYNASLYDRMIIENIAPHLEAIFEAILKDEESEPGQTEILSSDEKETYIKAREQRNDALLKFSVARDGSRSVSAKYAEPENEHQEKLLSIWNEILNPETSLGIDDNFFELGGHSLMATRIVSRIHKEFEIEINMQDFFDNPNIRKLSEVVCLQGSSEYAEIESLPDQEHYAVSHSQHRFWVLDKMEDNFIAYNQSAGFLFKGNLDISALKHAFTTVCERHESLRTTFVTVQGEPRQKIRKTLDIEIEESDLRGMEDNETLAKEYAKKEAALPLDLENGPLLRVKILRLSEDRRILLMNIHHIICDGWSLVVFENEILTLHKSFAAGKTIHASPLRIQYKDYAAWHNQLLDSENFKIHQEYWHKKLSGELPVLNLPTNYPRPPVQTYNGSTTTLILNAKLTALMDDFCRENQVSLFMTLVTAAKALLFRYTGQEDIIIGSPIAGRNHPDLEDQIGFFVNTLALRDTVSGNETFKSLLAKVRQTTLEAIMHQMYPFDRLVKELDIQRDVSRSPLFDVMLVLQNTEEVNADFENLEITPFEYETGLSQFDLTLIFTEDEGKLRLDMNYNTDLFEKETISRMGTHFEVFLKGISEDANQLIADPDILSEAEKQQILTDFNDTAAEYPKEKTLVDLFEEQVERTPDNIAVIFEEKRLTYKELNEATNRLAHHLRETYQIQPDDLVGVIINRSEGLIISLLGILKAGGAYLPIDPAYPQKRIDYMLNDSACKVLLTESGMQMPDIDIPCLEIETLNSQLTNDELQIENPQSPITSSNLAYIIYTSGSTGQPKGVMIEHRGFVNMTLAQIRGFGIWESDRVLQFSSPSFDASLSEIFMALLKGAGLVMISTETINDTGQFLEYLDKHDVSVITFPPVYLNMLNKHPLPTVRTIITAGEPAILSDVLFYCKDKQCFNAYGPTETSVCTSFYKVDPAFQIPYDAFRIPIGSPIANSSVFIVDETLRPVPVGVTGEICFSGVGLARGYLNKPELTAEKFVDSPFHPGKRLYKIGDLGRWLPDGNIDFLGRKDDQVKVRGFRIELGEIESRLKQNPLIEDALVLAIGENENARQLAAYIITKSEMDIGELRNFLGKTLPPFMIPAHFVQLEKFPLTVNGKIDKRALPDVSEASNLTRDATEYVPPQNEAESALINVWQKLFNKEKIGIRDDFFALGGDSVKAIQAVSCLHEENLKIKVRDIFQHPTVMQLAKLAVSSEQRVGTQEMVIGAVPLTAITAWFFKEFVYEKHHFNHSDMFHSKERLDEEALRVAFSALQEHHDILRMRVGKWREVGSPMLEICGAEYPLHFETLDLRGSEQAVPRLESYAETLQAGLNLETGPLMKAVLFRLDDGDRLLIVVHHLVSDAVSWRFFLEDLSQGYEQHIAGKSITLPLKTDSFKEWAEQIQEYSVSEELLREKEYWRMLETASVGELPRDDDFPEDALMKDTFIIEFTLPPLETEVLLTKAGPVYGAGTDEILLTALAYSLKQWHGNAKTLITLEGHGREDIISNADISRTMGWFTSTYPVILDSPDGSDVRYQIETIKSMLRNIPHRGIGYGILKYVTPQEYKRDLSFDIKPQISFNYLGQFDAYGNDFFEIAEESSGNAVSQNAKIIHDMDINAVVAEGELLLYFTMNGKCYQKESIENILSDFENKIKEVITICQKA